MTAPVAPTRAGARRSALSSPSSPRSSPSWRSSWPGSCRTRWCDSAAQTQAREQLGTQADLLAEVIDRQDDGVMGQMMSGARLRQLLAAQGISVDVVRPRALASPPVTAADLAVTRSGGSVSDVRPTGSAARCWWRGAPSSTIVA